MLSGPSLILHLEGESIISEWRRLIGPMLDAKENAPDSLRAKYQVRVHNFCDNFQNTENSNGLYILDL